MVTGCIGLSNLNLNELRRHEGTKKGMIELVRRQNFLILRWKKMDFPKKNHKIVEPLSIAPLSPGLDLVLIVLIPFSASPRSDFAISQFKLKI